MSRRGIVGLTLAENAAISAPSSGVRLGTSDDGPVSVRLFRLTGTSVYVAGALAAAQVVVLRALSGGTPVQVVTNRPHRWQTLLSGGGRAQLITETEVPMTAGGSALIVHDRDAEDVRRSGEAVPWQCRMVVRSRFDPAELRTVALSDVTILGPVPPALTGTLASVFGLPQNLVGGLTDLRPGVVGVMRRSRISYVALDPTQQEIERFGRPR